MHKYLFLLVFMLCGSLLQAAQVRLSMLLIPSKTQADSLWRAIQNKEPFADLALRFSRGAAWESGGDLGFLPEEDLDPEIRRLSLELQPGQVSKPTRTESGYLLLYVRDRKEASDYAIYQEALRKWRLWGDSLQVLVNKDNFEEARLLGGRNLAHAREAFGRSSEEAASSLGDLGVIHYYAGNYQTARTFYTDALQILQARLGPRHPELVPVLNNLAELYFREGDYDAALLAYDRILAILRLRSEEGDISDLPYLVARLNVLQEAGRFEEGELQAQEIDYLRLRYFQRTEENWATLLIELGEFYAAAHQDGKASDAFQAALAARKRFLGAEHLLVARLLNKMGLFDQDNGRLQVAEKEFKEALGIFTRNLGEVDPAAAAVNNNLGELYRAQGRYSEAELFLLKALASRESNLGATDPAVAETLNNLGLVYDALGRNEDAMENFRRAASILEERQPNSENKLLRTIYMNSLNLYSRLQRPEQVEELKNKLRGLNNEG